MTSLRSSLVLPALQGAVLGLVDPPGVGLAARILGGLHRPREAVPVGHQLLARIELWDDELVPRQHAVEAARAHDQALAIGRGDDQLDELIDRRVLDADRVAPARNVRGLGAPELALLVARRQGLRPQ